MFTGLVQSIGAIRELTRSGGGARIGIEAPSLPAADLSPGESVSVDGVCLTVTRASARRFHADVVRETLDCTTLGRARSGHRVHLERSLQLGDRLGGHLVLGHVDTVATVVRLSKSGADVRLRVALAREIERFVALKGSIALNGVSLTVSGVWDDAFEVALVPATLSRTNLGTLRAGDRLNVEVDLLARYLEKMMRRDEPAHRAAPGAWTQEWE
jgi:riboflavin synthase